MTDRSTSPVWLRSPQLHEQRVSSQVRAIFWIRDGNQAGSSLLRIDERK